jgi:hypothetical protein
VVGQINVIIYLTYIKNSSTLAELEQVVVEKSPNVKTPSPLFSKKKRSSVLPL